MRKENLFLSILLLLVLCYVVYRACSLSFTHDEALSFKIILGDPVLAATANNHFLNTFLMALCYRLFGNSEISLRLPNILGFILYAFACFELLKNRSFVIILCGVGLLLLNPYLVEFFSLARGYGLALGFFMMALVYLLRAAGSETTAAFYPNASAALLFSVAACFSNLTYLNANFVILFLLLLSFLRLKTKTAHSKWIYITGAILLINLCCTAGLIQELLKLKDAHQLYHGGSTGFFADTVAGLVMRSLYSASNGLPELLISRIVIVLYAIMLIYSVMVRSYNRLMIVLVFLSLMIAGSLVQFVFIGALLPFGRTALVYIPLMGVCIIFFMSDLSFASQRITRYAAAGACLLLAAAGVFNFANNMNTESCYEWRYDAHTKDIMNKINGFAQYSGQSESPFIISCNYFLEPSVNYYKIHNSMNFLILGGEVKKNADEDFIFSFNTDRSKVINADEYTPLETFDAEGVTVLKNLHHHSSKELYRRDVRLIASNNKFLSCETDHHILGNKNTSSLWETFSLIVYAGNKCAFRSYEGFFLCPELDFNAEVTATRQKRGPWEIFDVYNLEEGHFAFKAANNKYLSLEESTGKIYASASSIGKKETFMLVKK